MLKSLLCFALLLARPTAVKAQAQTPDPRAQQQTDSEAEAAALAQQTATLLSDLRALESESKELLKPLDAAGAKTEVAAAAWPLERAWAKKLLREAFELTLPAEVDRPKARAHTVGAPLRPPTPEDMARGMVRSRLLKVASAEPAFARELADAAARELGVTQEVSQYSQLASAAARDGRIEEAGELLRHAMDAEPTLIDFGSVINEVAARDRAAADRLMLDYVARLRALPLSVYTERNHVGIRLALIFMWTLSNNAAPQPWQAGPALPPGREVVRAYIDFVFDTMTRAEQARADTTQMHMMLVTLWPFVAEHAPELTAQFNALERASRRPGEGAPALNTFATMREGGDKRYEERLKTARQTKDKHDIEFAVSAAMSRKDFEEARKLLQMLKDEQTRSQLSEVLNEKEALHLTEKGDLAGAEKLARQLTSVASILQAYPPLVRRLARNKDAGHASLLTEEAVRRLAESAEKGAGNDSYVPGVLASFAGSIRVFKQTRALLAVSEIVLAVEPVATQAALDALDALVAMANKARVTSEHGNPNFNAEVFAKLSAADESRVAAAAARFEDRLQRIAALAAVYRARAERLDKKSKAARAAAAGCGMRMSDCGFNEARLSSTRVDAVAAQR